MEILFALFGIQPFALLKMRFFCMVEKEVRDLQVFSKLTCFFDCAVMFLVGLEFIGFAKQAESFVQEPVAAGHVMMVYCIVRLISQTGEFFSVIKLHSETELLRLCGGNVEKCHWTAEDFTGIIGLYDIKTDSSSHMPADFLLNGHICNSRNLLGQLFVTVDAKLSVVFSLVHALPDNPDEPDNTQHVVYVLMRYEDVVNIADINAGVFKHF